MVVLTLRFYYMHFILFGKQRLPSLEIQVIHIHHGLNRKSKRMGAALCSIMFTMGHSFICRHVGYSSQKGIEAAAREARYQVTEKNYKKARY